MIGRSQFLKLAQAGKPLHCVTFDFGPVRSNGLGGVQTNHYATKAQADKELAQSRANFPASRPTYSTRPISAEQARMAELDPFFVLV
jgi:hypothetical protein